MFHQVKTTPNRKQKMRFKNKVSFLVFPMSYAYQIATICLELFSSKETTVNKQLIKNGAYLLFCYIIKLITIGHQLIIKVKI